PRRTSIRATNPHSSLLTKQSTNFPCQFDCSRIRCPQKRRMCDPFQLLANCPIDPRMIMPVNICPDRRVSVDVFATTAVAQERAVPLDNHDWCMLRRAPFRHVSEGVPNKLFVCGNQFFGVPVGHPFGALKSYLVQRNIELGNAWPAFRGAHAPSRAGAGASPARTF